MASTTRDPGTFTPALIVIDMQEDFCPPNGSLAVNEARSLAPLINSLLALPGFVVKVATQDFHPPSHFTFAVNQPEPNNQPFASAEVQNPRTPAGQEPETKRLQLWPAHCVQGTPGAAIIPEIDTRPIDLYVQKAMHEHVEMFSPFTDVFGCDASECVAIGAVSVDLAAALKEKGVTDVFVVGVAGDYCVKFTAVDAAKAGFRTHVVEEGTKCIVPGEGWAATKDELRAHGVNVVAADGPELAAVKRQK